MRGKRPALLVGASLGQLQARSGDKRECAAKRDNGQSQGALTLTPFSVATSSPITPIWTLLMDTARQLPCCRPHTNRASVRPNGVDRTQWAQRGAAGAAAQAAPWRVRIRYGLNEAGWAWSAAGVPSGRSGFVVSTVMAGEHQWLAPTALPSRRHDAATSGRLSACDRYWRTGMLSTTILPLLTAAACTPG